MKSHPTLEELLKISFPLVMAPMFLVSNRQMIMAGMRSGIMAVFPSLNFRKEGELEALLEDLNTFHRTDPSGSYGVNLIVQKTNPYLKDHLKLCASYKVPFYITSLGDPAEVIAAAHAYGGKVFCDVTTMVHARKCAKADCDGFIAVGQGAGGHAGPNALQVLVPALKNEFPGKPVIAAGGIVDGKGLLSVKVLGADGVSIGTRFITSKESTVSDQYKQAILDAGIDDIVMTTRLSGSPCTIINTPEAERMGYTQTWLEKFMSNNPRTKKWFKMFVQARGLNLLEDSVLPNNYSKLWCAGKSSGLINHIQSCEEIIAQIRSGYLKAIDDISNGSNS
jgi:nitronate monooxygenase